MWYVHGTTAHTTHNQHIHKNNKQQRVDDDNDNEERENLFIAPSRSIYYIRVRRNSVRLMLNCLFHSHEFISSNRKLNVS